MIKSDYIILTALILLTACQSGTTEKTIAPDSPDTALIRKTGADPYGMRKYIFCYLKKGPNRKQDSATAARLQQGHMENIGKLAEAGKLILAGPFLDTGEIRGIFIFNCKTLEEARALTQTDPAVQAGRLTMELHEWYGSAALMMVNEQHKKLESKKITD